MDLLLYGLDEAREPTFAERVAPHERHRIRELAAGRLASCHAVEVWEGPTCILRLRRRSSGAEPGL